MTTQHVQPVNSPWAERYGEIAPGHPFKYGNTVHSGFAPVHPSLHPVYFVDIPNDEIPRPSAEDLDRQFLTENFQLTHYYGYLTSRYATFKRWVDLGGVIDGGHSWDNFPTPIPAAIATNRTTTEAYRRIYYASLFNQRSLVVDETRWFSFFRRDRWLKTKDYNPDDPRLWAVLERSIELASRMLQAAVDDQHEALQTALYGRFDYMQTYRNVPQEEATDTVLLSLRQERIECAKTNSTATGEYMTSFGPVEWRNRLESLLQGVFWFVPHRESPLGWDMPDSGETRTFEGPATGSGSEVTCISVGDRAISALMYRGDLSLSEQCHLYYGIATTLIHELMHALLNGRRHDDRTFGNYIPMDGIDVDSWLDVVEIDIDFTKEEPGFWLEKQLFGGIVEMRFQVQFGDPGIPLALRHDNEPMNWVVSSLHTSRLLSESFWTNASIPRKSDNFFHWNPIFGLDGDADTAPTITEDPTVQQTSEYRLLVPELEARNAVLNSLQAGWKDVEHLRWDGTLWSMEHFRTLLAAIPYWFKKAEEIKCAIIANHFVAHMDWADSANFASQLPAPGRKLNYCAASAASVAGTANPLIPVGHEIVVKTNLLATSLWGDSNEVPPSELYDPLTLRYRSRRLIVSTQLDYLRAFRDLLEAIAMSGSTVEGEWLGNLFTAATAIRQKRQDPRYPYNKWIDKWPFQVPPYKEQNVMVRYDQATKKWRQIP
ncbi:hypothetical protein F5Y18DRAFT_421908 [Xylariaceae sp. FL1019]|nr:hypothetical protein F5Y18DRAFT_421908 [Xylariaceae sp. FL1019]